MSTDQPDPAQLEQVARWVHAAERVLFITGAGMSAESGLPTYRGVGGLYNRPDTDEGLPIEVLLGGQMMRERPDVCWKYIGEIEAACRGAKPNRGHEAIAQLEQHAGTVMVLTQNVDGLHTRAGSQDIIEIHGNLHRLRCVGCTWRDEVTDYSDLTLPPSCPRCESLVRPDVVLFGEMLPSGAVQRYQSAIDRGFDLVLSVGTTSVFPYIAEPVIRARHHGVPTVEINPGDTTVSKQVDLRIRTGAAAFLGALVGVIRG